MKTQRTNNNNNNNKKTITKRNNGKQARKTTRRAGASTTKSGMPRMQVTNVPFQSAITVQQSNRRDTMRYTASERIGSISLGSAVSSATAYSFNLSPGMLRGTRLEAMSKLYQRFRFTSAELLINCNLSTATTGSLVAGFTGNPDMELDSSPLAQIYSLPSAKSMRLWVPTTIKANMTPLVPGGWFTNDVDSAEIMWTNQGKFFIAIESQPSITGMTEIPIILNYTIEFALPVAPTQTNTSYDNPAMTWTISATAGNDWFTSLTTLETAPLFDVPTTKSKTVYAMVPAPSILVTNQGGDIEKIDVAYVLKGAGVTFWLFTAENLEAALANDVTECIKGYAHADWTTPRTTWYAIE